MPATLTLGELVTRVRETGEEALHEIRMIEQRGVANTDAERTQIARALAEFKEAALLCERLLARL